MNLIKAHNHSHFYIEEGVLYEVYKTIKGERSRYKGLISLPDYERITKQEIEELLNKKQDGEA